MKKEEEKEKGFVAIRQIIDDIRSYMTDIDSAEYDDCLVSRYMMCWHAFQHMQDFELTRWVVLGFEECEYYSIEDKMSDYLNYVRAYVEVLLQVDMISCQEYDFYLAGIIEFRKLFVGMKKDYLPFEI